MAPGSSLATMHLAPHLGAALPLHPLPQRCCCCMRWGSALQGHVYGCRVYGCHLCLGSVICLQVCWLPRPLSQADVALLAATKELEVQQETPIRVGVGVGVETVGSG